MTPEQEELRAKILTLLKQSQGKSWEEIRRTLPEPDSEICCHLQDLQLTGIIRADVVYSIVQE